MNSSQNKRVKYEHSYKPWTALKTRGRNMNTPTNHEQLSKQEGEIWTLLQTMNSSQKYKREKYEHSYKPWTALKTRGWNMNTPTNHEQLSNQEAEIWTLLQTTNSSQNKRQKYEHSYKPWTALKTRDRNTNTPTNHEQLSKIQEAKKRTLLQTMNSSQNKWQKYEHSYKPRTAQKTRGRNMNTPTNHEQLSK